MISSTPLSSLKSNPLNCDLKGLSFKQFTRSYPGGYNFSFNKSLSGFRDNTIKNNSNFLLTDMRNISDVINLDDIPLKASTIFGPIRCGSSYMKYSDVDPSPFSRTGKYFDHFDYGAVSTSDTDDETTKFSFIISDNNTCNIVYHKNYDAYYLCSTSDNGLVFVKKSRLSFDTEKINAQDFFYLFSENTNDILLFKNTSDGNYILIKKDNQIILKKVISDNIATYISSPFSLSKSIYLNSNLKLDTSYIKYNTDNTINIGDSYFSLTNNLLLHKPLVSDKLDILVLKNQLSKEDVFTNNNNLLSGYSKTYSGKLRTYSSISKDIMEEYSDELSLNYVYYNENYTITPGENYIETSDSLYPFESLNINDTKFVENGAFSYITPEYADKVYHLSNDKNNKDNNQHLLCTWLSGSPMGDSKIWVDRYYYPDRIEKLEALQSNPIYNDTYNSYIEQLIINNQTYSDSVDALKFFDKRSELVFLPNQIYRYDRIKNTDFPTLTSQFNYCNSYSKTYPSNYHRNINDAGEFTISFGFVDDGKNWVIESDRNSIDCGLKITKDGSLLQFEYNFYNPSTELLKIFQVNNNIKPNDLNVFTFSINSKTGKGYVFFNNEIILDILVSPFEYYTKQLLYGDIFYYQNGEKRDILDIYYNSELFKDLLINPYYTQPELAFTTHILNSESTIDDIIISLPCGMRNAIDDVQSLNLACSSQFKSNAVNIKILNTNIDDSVKSIISNSIEGDLSKILPVNTQINDIIFEDYK